MGKLSARILCKTNRKIYEFSEFEDTFVKTLDNKQHSQELKNKGIDIDDPQIRDNSFYYLETKSNVENIRLYFTHKNHHAKIVDGRLG